MIKKILKKTLPTSFYKKLQKKFRKAVDRLNRDRNLSTMAQFYGSDKWGGHFYTPHYENHFNPFKNRSIKILELGIGGYADPNKGGASLRMWKNFFRKGNIFGIDIYDKSQLEESRIQTFKGSQVDEDFLKKILKKIGTPDIIIDDGSHLNEHIIDSFKILFPLLKKGGIYVIEDIQTSYWPEYGGDSENIENKKNAINYFKGLVHGLNFQEMLIENYKPTYFDLNITSIHFYHNLIFIYKGDNDEPSNMVRNNKLKI